MSPVVTHWIPIDPYDIDQDELVCIDESWVSERTFIRFLEAKDGTLYSETFERVEFLKEVDA